MATATGGYRREVFLLRVPGPRGPGRCYAAPPGLVKWVNRESFTKPTLWYGSPARAEWIWMLKMFKFAASTFSLQARRAGIEMPVARATGFYLTKHALFLAPLPCRAAMGEVARVRGHCSPPAIGSGVFAIATMDSCCIPMN